MFSPKFSITNKILKFIGKIEASKEIIESAPLVPAFEAKFRQEAVIRTVHHGTHIEGNPLNTGEVAAVLEGQQIDARDRDVQEILNYREVLKYIDKSQKSVHLRGVQRSGQAHLGGGQSARFTEKDLLKLHQLTVNNVLPTDRAGKYRITQVVVKNSKTGEISFKPPLAEQIKELTGDFLKWLNSDGRTARAFATLVLFIRGYDIKKFFSLEEYFDKNAKLYYETLQAVSNQKVQSLKDRDLTIWLEYFCEGLSQELEMVKERVQKLSLDSRLKGRTGQIALSERQMKIVEYIEANGSISNRAWRSILKEFSDDTILRDLKDLQKKGLIKKKGSTKGAVYILK
jgi:Fic family protein